MTLALKMEDRCSSETAVSTETSPMREDNPVVECSTMLQNLENIQENIGVVKKSTEKVKNGRYETKKTKRKRRLVATSIGECETSNNDEECGNTVLTTGDEETDAEVSNEVNNGRNQQGRKERSKLKKKLDESFNRSNNSSASDNVDSDSDPEIYQVRPTRSGRLPKVKKLRRLNMNRLDSDPEIDSSINDETAISSQETLTITEDVLIRDNTNLDTSDNITNMIPDINQIEPGSLVILSKESTDEPGDTILQVYMVSSNIENSNEKVQSNLTPVDLPPELLATVTTKLEDVESVNMTDDCE